SCRPRLDYDERLRPGMVVGQGKMDMCQMAVRRQLCETSRRAILEPQGRRARRQVNDTDVLHVNALEETGPDRLGVGFLGGESLGIGSRARERPSCRLRALELREAARLEPLAIPVERGLDAFDAAQVGAHSDDHGTILPVRRSRMGRGTAPRRGAAAACAAGPSVTGL